METSITIRGNIVDILAGRIFAGRLEIRNGRIARIVSEEESGDASESRFILPGLIDSHVHIESSMLIPSEFARAAVVHGTVGSVSDPHELANVLGVEGVRFMVNNGRKSPFKFAFGAPSCVPATGFETSGAVLDAADVEALLEMPEIKYLSEMMNFPGVLHQDETVMRKLALARRFGKPVDGHAPGLRGEDARRYAQAGISTDHECFNLEEALEKIKYGMKILIREGSAAKNFDELLPVLARRPDMVMFCSDDLHPDNLLEGHIDRLIRRALVQGYDLFDVLRAATLNPIRHYGLDAGLLQEGDPADLIIVDDLERFTVLKTYIDGRLAARDGRSLLEPVAEGPVNIFEARPFTEQALALPAQTETIRVIRALDGQLITEATTARARIKDGLAISDPERDILKLMVLQRYRQAPPALAFIQGFGLRTGALASTIAHDSHNIIAVGANDADMARAVNLLVENRGGISVVHGDKSDVLPLPYGGLMSADGAQAVAAAYQRLDAAAKNLGSPLTAPFMTLSFMALLVIPALKLSDKGLFDGTTFSFVPLFVS
ncbi:adenine deaminase [Desulfonatronum sp. SC1]|uniref:adenine deaminase n=1 Tax=Desulfonatronum sp. SC1 TaxID=2109626 RepID=UPI000D2F6AAF|nr:adenine deaminase [Desulfonatronum sp. SC1]PTN38069.1 adenine deaminase [Desulfonatronum sp. SC1]